MILAPKGWTFRDINGTDISNEQQFKARFTQPSTSVKVKLKDGNSYTSDQLGAKMLLAMGYTSQEAGKIIKNNKC